MFPPLFSEIRAQIDRIAYRNEENGYTIARAHVAGMHGRVTVVGTLLSVNAGEVLQLKGQWHKHPKFGEQFQIASYQTAVPATVNGIEKYLGSGLIKGIGPVMAKRLVSTFGAHTLRIIETDIEKLLGVEGIGAKRIEMIRAAWDDQKEIREVMLFLQSYGVTPALGAKIFKQYGRQSIQVLRDNPYRLATDIFGIGFLTADRIAEKMHVAKESPMRVEAGILFVLHQLSEEGHVCYPLETLVEECGNVLGVGRDIVVSALEKSALHEKVIIEDFTCSGGLKKGTKTVYLAKFHASETGAAKMLQDLMLPAQRVMTADKDKALQWVQQELSMKLAEQQKTAVREVLDKKVLVVTGGPGTGKTTLIHAVIRIFKQLGQRVLLAAPTGRAAKRMTEATGHEAKTIHRLLEFSPREGRFKRDESSPLQAEVIIVDEASMIDAVLIFHFLKAVPRGATVLFVGDVDQLPSVGAGNVLRDIIGSGVIPTVRLTEIFRQAKESLITVNAHRINSGQMPVIEREGGRLHDFYFFSAEEPERVLDKIIELCQEKIPSKFGFDPLEDVQVLTPMHRGLIGAANLNEKLQKRLNASSDELVRGGKVLKTGDKVMQVRNNYDKDIFNGDIGRIAVIDRETQEVIVNYDGRPVPYEYAELDEIVLAYAVSVHKAQGSEYPVIVMPIHTQHYMLLQRNLLYTGITRGKNLVIVVGSKKAIALAVKNNTPQRRYSFLQDRLRGLAG